jgi:hypothetical protein
MPESIGDLIALVLGLIVICLCEAGSQPRRGRAAASRPSARARHEHAPKATLRPPGHRARPMPRHPSLFETSDLGDEKPPRGPPVPCSPATTTGGRRRRRPGRGGPATTTRSSARKLTRKKPEKHHAIVTTRTAVMCQLP